MGYYPTQTFLSWLSKLCFPPHHHCLSYCSSCQLFAESRTLRLKELQWQLSDAVTIFWWRDFIPDSLGRPLFLLQLTYLSRQRIYSESKPFTNYMSKGGSGRPHCGIVRGFCKAHRLSLCSPGLLPRPPSLFSWKLTSLSSTLFW